MQEGVAADKRVAAEGSHGRQRSFTGWIDLEGDSAIRELEEQIENCNRDLEYVRRREINVEVVPGLTYVLA